MHKRTPAFRKSDLVPAFQAAKDAGFQEVSITIETPDGKRFLITAGIGRAAGKDDMTPLERWRAGNAAG